MMVRSHSNDERRLRFSHEPPPLRSTMALLSISSERDFYNKSMKRMSDTSWWTNRKLEFIFKRGHFANTVLVMSCLLMIASQSCDAQVSRLRDLSNDALLRQSANSRRVIRPPNRPLPPETILLENGSTTFVSSLDDFMESQSTTTTSTTETLPTFMELDEEDETNSSELVRPAVVEVDPSRETTNEGGKRSAEVSTNYNRTTQRLDRNSKLAIVYTVSPPAETHSEAMLEPANNFNHSRGSATPPSVLIEPINTVAPPRGGIEAPLSQHNNEHGGGSHPMTSTETSSSSANKSKPIPQHWQVKSLLNVTHDYPLAYSQIICGYVWPLMAAITLFTNLMIVFVLTQRDMRTPTNVVLTAIAIADIIPIVVPVPWFIYLFAMGNEKQVLYPPVACYFYQHSTRSVSEIFYFLSTWLNVLLAIQDYLTACQPKLAKKYCQIRVVVVEIVLLTFSAFLLNLPQALKVVFKPVKFYYNNQLTWGCKALQARWFKDLIGEYVALYDDIFTAIIVVFVDGGPAVVLITLTTLLIRQLHKRRIQGHKLMEQARTASKRRRERHRQQEYESSARVMIFVLLAFLAVKIPFATTYTLMIIQSRFGVHFVDNLLDFQKAITLTDLVFVLSYPINFTIFCCCSKKFRHKCAQLLGECNDTSRTTRDRLMSNLSGSINSSSLANSISRRFSSVSKFQGGNSVGAGLNQRLDESDSLEIKLNRKDSEGAAPKKFSLAEYANNAQIPTFRNYPQHQQQQQEGHQPQQQQPQQQQQQQQQQQHEQQHNLDARSRASSRSSFSSMGDGAGASAAANRKSSQSGNLTPQPHPTPCSGCEQQRRNAHHEQQQFAPSANQEHFKRLLEEGSLCLECIVCYERIRSESSLLEVGLASSSVLPMVANQMASGQPELSQQQEALMMLMRDREARRASQASDSSASWSVGVGASAPPPPPQLRSLATLQEQCQHLTHITQLPQIVTTACDERSSLEEVTQSQEARQATDGMHFGEIGQPSWQQEAATRAKLEHQTLVDNSSLAEAEFNTASRHSISGSKVSDNMPRSQASHLGSCSQSSGTSGRVSRSKSRDTNDYEPSVGHSLGRPSTSMMTRVSCSDPGDVNEQAARQQQATQEHDHPHHHHHHLQHANYSSGAESGEPQGEPATGSTDERRSRRRHHKRGQWQDRKRSNSDETDRSDEDGDALFSERGVSPGRSSGRPMDERTTISEQAMSSRGKRGQRAGHDDENDGSRLDARRGRFGSRQRSLSLSSSNLTTLPNATGMLADVLVSVLFGGAPGDEQESSSATATCGEKKRHHHHKRGKK